MEKTVSGVQHLRFKVSSGFRLILVCYIIISLFGFVGACATNHPVKEKDLIGQQRSLNEIYLEKILNWFH